MVYLPLAVFTFILLFPFYWMTITALKGNDDIYDYEKSSPFWVVRPTLANIKKLLFDTSYPEWLWNTMLVSRVDVHLVVRQRAGRLRGRAPALSRAAAGWDWPFTARTWYRLRFFLSPWRQMVFELGLFDTRWALILTYPTFLIPFCTWLLMGYFRSIPYELEECALVDGATRLQILIKIVLPLALPGLISAAIFAFTLSWNEFIYALTFVASSEIKTVPVGVLTELVDGDVYHWGPLMAGALFGSIPVAVLYSFFVEYYVSGMTGAIKE